MTILFLCYGHVDTSQLWHLLSVPESSLVFFSISFLFCWVLIECDSVQAVRLAHKARYWSLLAGWPLCTETGQWQCDLHYSNASLHRAVISMPGKLMSLCCRLRLGRVAPHLPWRGSHSRKWILWLTATRDRQALLRADGIFVFASFANGSLSSLFSSVNFYTLPALSCSHYQSPC